MLISIQLHSVKMIHTIIAKFWPSVLLAQFAEALVNKYTVRRDCLHCARGIVTHNDEGEIKIPSKPCFLLLEQLNENNLTVLFGANTVRYE